MSVDEEEYQYIWQDREIRFDLSMLHLEYRPGEFEIDSINAVEDTKGNNGERGSLVITNLRLIWSSATSPKTNLSVGYNCVTSATVKNASSRLKGNSQALYVMTKYNASRFEFVFTSLVKNSPRLFTTIQAVTKAYESTRLYRDLKLRGAIIKDKQLLLLPDEEVTNKIGGVWNLSSDQGNLGTFFVTNVRLVWHANLAENFNVSIPYLQMKSIRVRDSKFGNALVIETSAKSGGYILGFRIDPVETLDAVFKEIHSLFVLYSREPLFGVKFSHEERPQPAELVKVERKMDDIEIINNDFDAIDALAAYYADGDSSQAKEVVYNSDLGLAIEKLKDGITAEQLFMLTLD